MMVRGGTRIGQDEWCRNHRAGRADRPRTGAAPGAAGAPGDGRAQPPHIRRDHRRHPRRRPVPVAPAELSRRARGRTRRCPARHHGDRRRLRLDRLGVRRHGDAPVDDRHVPTRMPGRRLGRRKGRRERVLVPASGRGGGGRRRLAARRIVAVHQRLRQRRLDHPRSAHVSRAGRRADRPGLRDHPQG